MNLIVTTFMTSSSTGTVISCVRSAVKVFTLKSVNKAPGTFHIQKKFVYLQHETLLV